jgi:hypothetical protein
MVRKGVILEDYRSYCILVVNQTDSKLKNNKAPAKKKMVTSVLQN